MSPNRNLSDSAEKLLQSQADEAHAQAGEVQDDVASLGSRAKKAATETLRDVRDGAADLLEHGQEKLEDVGRVVRRRIQSNPVPAMLVAVGVGLLLGVVWTWRARK